MNDEFYLDDVTDFLNQVYKDEHPDFVITPRIAQMVYSKITEDYIGESSILKPGNTELCDWLRDETIVRFIDARQPDVSPVPEYVRNDIIKYFQAEINGFTPVKACRHSNHPEDDYLYSVIAKKDNSDEYACWSTFNDSIKSMNSGHYNLATEEDAFEILKDYFFDITDDMERFGPQKSLTEIENDIAVRATRGRNR